MINVEQCEWLYLQLGDWFAPIKTDTLHKLSIPIIFHPGNNTPQIGSSWESDVLVIKMNLMNGFLHCSGKKTCDLMFF
jgi:hypothetical protein